MQIKQFSSSTILLVLFATSCVNFSEGRKSNRRRQEDDDKSKIEADASSDRQKLFEDLDDPESSAQAISSAAVNPYTSQLLLQNQAALLNNPALYGGGTPNTNSAIGSGQGFNGNSFVNAAVGGLSAYQNPLLFGGANIPGIGSPDIFSQSAAAAQLYNNPYLGASALNGAGISAGINPLLLRGATNLQYPIVAGNPYLSAQALLSPYSNYNQLNPYNNFPFASRFGIGVGRSSLANRQNSNSNNDE